MIREKLRLKDLEVKYLVTSRKREGSAETLCFVAVHFQFEVGELLE